MLWVTVILHYLTDMATSIFQPLGPYFTEKFAISPKTFAMTLYSISLMTSIFQPLFGMITDRVEKRNLYLASVVSLTILSAYMISLAKSFIMVITMALIAQLANSAFHPMGASIAGQRKKGHHIALFSLAGMFGYATGPVFITWYAQEHDLKGLYILGISLSVLAFLAVIKMKFLRVKREMKVKVRLGIFSDLFPIMMYIAFRSFAMGLAQIYGPMYIKQLGGALIVGGSLLTMARFTGMGLSFLGVFLRGKLSNNFVNILSSSFMAFFGLLFMFSHSMTSVIVTYVIMLSSAYLSMSSNVVEAQDRAPLNPGLASSIAMGLAWSLGSTMNLVYSYLFGNDVSFMVKSFWVVSALSILFSVLDLMRKKRSS